MNTAKMRKALLEATGLHLGIPRVFEFLCSKGKSGEDGRIVTERFTLAEIALELGMTRDLVMRLINRMEKRSILLKYPNSSYGRKYEINPLERWDLGEELSKPLNTKNTKKKLVCVYLQPDLVAEIKNLAAENRCPMNKTLTGLVLAGLQATGG